MCSKAQLLQFVTNAFSKEIADSLDSFVVDYLAQNICDFQNSNSISLETIEQFSDIRNDLNTLCEDYLNGFSKLSNTVIYNFLKNSNVKEIPLKKESKNNAHYNQKTPKNHQQSKSNSTLKNSKNSLILENNNQNTKTKEQITA
jgi:hypothetical protein